MKILRYTRLMTNETTNIFLLCNINMLDEKFCEVLLKLNELRITPIMTMGQEDIDKFILKFVADDYWSASNPNPNAKYPRWAHNVDNTNTYQKSTFWLRDGSFLRLKNAEIGYSYKFMRAYIAGSNLLTFTGFKYWDPEIGGGSNSGNGLVYPLQRVFNLGVQFNF